MSVGIYILLVLIVFMFCVVSYDVTQRIQSHFWLRRKWKHRNMFHRKDGKFWVSSKPPEANKPERIKENA